MTQSKVVFLLALETYIMRVWYVNIYIHIHIQYTHTPDWKYMALNIELRHLCQRENTEDRWRNSILKQVVRATYVPKNGLLFAIFCAGLHPCFFLNIKLPLWDIDGASPTHSPKSGWECPHRWRKSLIPPNIPQQAKEGWHWQTHLQTELCPVLIIKPLPDLRHLHACMHACTYTFTYTHTHTHVYIYIYLFIYMFIYCIYLWCIYRYAPHLPTAFVPFLRNPILFEKPCPPGQWANTPWAHTPWARRSRHPVGLQYPGRNLNGSSINSSMTW